MPENAIEIRSLSKRYKLNAREYLDEETFASAAARRVRNAFTQLRRRDDERTIWAVRDVTLDIPQGQAAGLVGHNGAGKSTLLNIVARLTLPTAGSVTLRGRVGSMLSLGVGFNGELTGRENVFLSAAMLGMGRRETRRKFEEIVEFSGLDREFIDVAVKRYSNGMRVRLAFSVMSAIEPDILLVDEVLGVGDYEFQERSRGRMRELIRSGRTVLLVSHNKNEIDKICDRRIRMSHGEVAKDVLLEEVRARKQAKLERKRAARQLAEQVEGGPGELEATNQG